VPLKTGDVAIAKRLTGNQVELQVTDAQAPSVLLTRKAHQRAYAGHQLRHRERFNEIIVGAGIQAPKTIVQAVARRQNQHRHRPLLRPHLVEPLEPTPPRQHQVEDDGVEDLDADRL